MVPEATLIILAAAYLDIVRRVQRLERLVINGKA